MNNKMAFVRDCSGSVDPKVLRECLNKITAIVKDPNLSEKDLSQMKKKASHISDMIDKALNK